MKTKLHIELQNETQFPNLPDPSQLQKWVEKTIQLVPSTVDKNKSEITLRFIDKQESAELNETYRHKKGATNVLSFPDESIPGFTSNSFGDLAICAPLVAEEAKAQKKTLEAHFAHLIIHGILHLLEYDHVEKKEAAEMENLEIKILARLGYEDPYR